MELVAKLFPGLPYLFQCRFFPLFTCCVGVAQLVSGFLPEGIIPYVAVDLVCLWEKVSSGASYIPEPNHSMTSHGWVAHFLLALNNTLLSRCIVYPFTY